jgi:hypothetical protein
MDCTDFFSTNTRHSSMVNAKNHASHLNPIKQGSPNIIESQALAVKGVYGLSL